LPESLFKGVLQQRLE